MNRASNVLLKVLILGHILTWVDLVAEVWLESVLGGDLTRDLDSRDEGINIGLLLEEVNINIWVLLEIVRVELDNTGSGLWSAEDVLEDKAWDWGEILFCEVSVVINTVLVLGSTWGESHLEVWHLVATLGVDEAALLAS